MSFEQFMKMDTSKIKKKKKKVSRNSPVPISVVCYSEHPTALSIAKFLVLAVSIILCS